MTDASGPPPPPAVTPPPGPGAPGVPAKLPKGALIAAPIVFVVTAAVGVVMIVMSLFTVADAVGSFRTLPVGETRTLELDGGDWYVVAGGTSTDVGTVVARMVDASGRPVPVVADPASVDVEADGLRYRAIGAFAVPGPGTYQIAVDGPPTVDVRIGRVPITRFVVLLVGGIGVGGVGFLVALVLLVVGLLVRSSAKKRRAAARTVG